MKALRSIRWIIFGLLIASLLAYPLLDRPVEDRIAGQWETVFEGDRARCDLSNARMHEGPPGKIWITGTREYCEFFNSIHILENGLWTEIPQGAIPVHIDAQGQLWSWKEIRENNRSVGVDILKRNGGEWQLQASLNLLALDERFVGSRGLMVGPGDQLWVWFSRKPTQAAPTKWGWGLAVYRDQTWTITVDDQAHPYLSEDTQLIGPWWDEQGQAWFLEPRGVVRSDGREWEYDRLAQLGLSGGDRLVAFALDAQGTVWLASEAGYVLSGSGEQWSSPESLGLDRYASTRALADHGQVHSLFGLSVDRFGRIWMYEDEEWSANIHVYGSYPLQILDGESWTTLTSMNAGLPDEGINELMIDSKGDLWIVSPSAILRHTPTEEVPTLPALAQVWMRIRGTEWKPLGLYWLAPLLLLLAWFCLAMPPTARVSALSLLLSCLPPAFLLLLFPAQMVFREMAANRYRWQVVGLAPVLGLLGAVLGLAALAMPSGKQIGHRRMAIGGIVLGVLQIVLSVALGLLIVFTGN